MINFDEDQGEYVDGFWEHIIHLSIGDFDLMFVYTFVRSKNIC